jgi:hypothetical protein
MKPPIDANTQFANIDDIVKVQAEIEARRKEYNRLDSAKLAREMAEDVKRVGMAPLLYIFQVASDANVPTESTTM